jgi:hypothetical protein
MNQFEWKLNDTRATGAFQRLRSKRVAEKVSGEEIDDWLKQSIELVAGCVKGLGTNQRRVRYFGFEASHEQIKE